ncbi:MAG: ABC transporter permease [Actinomycetota bacterium]
MRPYLVAAWSSGRRALAARGPLAIRMLFYVVILGVLIALWKAATDANGGTVSGYDFAAIVWYLVGAEACVIAVDPRMIERIGTEIGTGDITTEMLRPISVAGLRMAATFGEVTARFACAIVIGGAFAWFQVGPPPHGGAAIVAIGSGLLALGCNLAAQHTFSAMAFWLRDSKASWFLYQKLVFLLGGMLLPLEMFPDWLQRVAWLVPFWTMSYGPARLLSGHPEPMLIVGQLLWLPVLVAIALAAFARGERRLEAVGG